MRRIVEQVRLSLDLTGDRQQRLDQALEALDQTVVLAFPRGLNPEDNDAALTAAVVAEAEARGLILLSCGTRYNVIRLLPPLTIPKDQLDEALAILESALEAAVMRTSA